MSDSQNPNEPHDAAAQTPAEIVEHANSALADADAARADVSSDPTVEPVISDETDGTTTAAADAADAAAASPAADEAVAAVEGTSDAAHADAATDAAAAPIVHPDADTAAAAAAAAAMADDDDTPWYDRPEVTSATATLPPAVVDAAPATTPLLPPVADAPVTPSEPVAQPVIPAAPQPIFVQAPEPPRKRGNRGFSGAVALLATIIFAVGYLAARLFLGASPVAPSAIGDAAFAALTSWTLWVPVAFFFFGFWLLGAFLNTAKWGYWVVFGLLVGLAALAGHALGEIFQQNIFKVTPDQAAEIFSGAVFSASGLVAFVLGRELPVWFGGWIARRGRRVIAANDEAQEEYQRTLEAGPQLRQE